MSRPRYPVFLDLRDKPVLVVGAGRVAVRKVKGLLEAGARVRVVAPEAADEIRGMAASGRLVWVSRGFEPADLEGTVLAFVATSDPAVNRAAAAAARERGVWANVADDPGASDVHVPAVMRQGPVAVAVSTGGASPELAAWLRDRVAEALPRRLGDLAEWARQVRQRAQPGAVARLLARGVADDLDRGDREAVDRKVSEVLAGAAERPSGTEEP